jgi:hypothetical protein
MACFEVRTLAGAIGFHPVHLPTARNHGYPGRSQRAAHLQTRVFIAAGGCNLIRVSEVGKVTL